MGEWDKKLPQQGLPGAVVTGQATASFPVPELALEDSRGPGKGRAQDPSP